MKLDWKHLFNWDVVAVKAPQKVVQNGRVIGYNVVVTYKHHGVDTEFYSTDDERMYTTYVSPQVAAREAYKTHLRNMKKQSERRMRTR